MQKINKICFHLRKAWQVNSFYLKECFDDIVEQMKRNIKIRNKLKEKR